MMTAHDQPDQLNIEDVRDLLSPYLDDEVTAEERALVEQAMADSAELRQELETLRQTVALVAALPQVPAPRPFTLSEADVQVSAPVARRYFRLPTWVRGWAMLAATLLCVLTIGGLFLSQQFGRSTYPAAEIARLEQSAAPPATATSREGVGAAKEEAPAEPAAVEEAAPVEQVTEEEEIPAEAAAEEAAPAEPLVEKEVETVELEVEAEVPAADEAAEDTFSMAGEPTESLPTTQTEAAESEVAEQDTGVGGGVTPTASPVPTAAALPTPTAAEEEKALAEKAAPAPPASPTAAGEPAQLPEAEPGPNLEPGGALTPRPVEIQNQRVRVTPGLIQIEGLIEAMPGSTLLATLQRNNQPFDQWADPTSLQTVVRANGQFSFTIRAQTGRADKDLFATEPANYQIIITSAAVEEPVVASVFFNTTGPLAATQQPTATSNPTATSTPRPTPTVVARVTFIPTATPTIAPPPTPVVTEAEPSANVPVRLIVTGIVLLGVLIVIGLVVWLIIRKQR